MKRLRTISRKFERLFLTHIILKPLQHYMPCNFMQWSVSINAMWKKQSKDLDTLFRDGASRLFSHPLTCQWWSSSRHPPCLLVWYQHCWNDSGYQTGLLKEFRKILSKTQTRVRKQSSGDKESVPFVTWKINRLQRTRKSHLQAESLAGQAQSHCDHANVLH